MPKFTAFLKLTLPELHEFLNSWNEPINQNTEDVDDWLSDLYKALVTSGSSSLWADLRGTKASLADRLSISIKPDGTLDVSNSPDILNMSNSAVEGQFASPRDRLNEGDFHSFDARQPVAGGRFSPIPADGPTAAFPPERIDSGIALRSTDFGAKTTAPIASPHVPWSPGLVIGGANPLVTGLGIGKVRITADSPSAVFNIDGYIFRIREIIDFDWNLLGPSNGDYVWFFVDRNEASYNTPDFRYTAPGGGGVAAKDLRRLQSGVDGVTSVSTFSSATALFNTKSFGKVKAGDTLVLTTGPGAGSYVIDALDITTPDTKFTIRGVFAGNGAGATWYVLDTAHPNIGAVVTDTEPTTLPPFVQGRVYIGRAIHSGSGNPTGIVTFAPGGVWDSGWITVDASADFPLTVTHDLGTFPTSVEVWCWAGGTALQIYQPLVKRSLVTDVAGSVSASFLLPSMQIRSSDLDIVVRLLNASATPSSPSAIFTDSSDVDMTTCDIRIIARR